MSAPPRPVEGFLAGPHLATFTTARPDGSSHVVPVRFTWDGTSGLARILTRAMNLNL
ncbi:pyridoxamine 5'-phosphate oxidase family protein [Nonomuraea sp. M3C6]|uniref:Pyridoxamine 5'-phosphate oxidase family protein n=1 Tax=Nonomuraea marmarensis TaxID=3351344 RepID=A0ABW7AB82_9ACTN